MSLIVSILSGQYFYIPDNDINALYFTDKHEINLSLTAPLYRQQNIQFGYSPFKYISVSGAYFHHKQTKRNHPRSTAKTEGQSFTGALGWYRYIHKLKKHNFFLTKGIKGVLIHAQLGYSNGSIDNIQEDLTFVKLKHQIFFLRTGISIDFGFLELSFSNRYLQLDFQAGDVGGNINDIFWIDHLYEDVEKDNPHPLKESTYRICFKTRVFELYGNYNNIREKYNPRLRSAYYEKGNFNLGLNINIDQFYRSIAK